MLFYGIVTLVNLNILWSSHNYTFFSFFLVFGSILTFIIAFWLVNLLDYSWSQDIYEEFRYVMWSPLSYFAMFLMTGGLAFFDYGMLLYRQTFYYSILKQEEEAAAEKLKKLQKDRSVVTRRMTNINCKALTASNLTRPRLCVLSGPGTGTANHGALNDAHAGAPEQARRDGRGSISQEEGIPRGARQQETHRRLQIRHGRRT